MTLYLRSKHVLSEKLRARLGLSNLTDELVLEHGSGYHLPGFNASVGLEGQL